MRRDKSERRRRRRWWWGQLFSGDNTQVNTMAVIAVCLSTPVAVLSFVALVYEIFWLGKGLTSSSVQLLTALLTAATGGLGASMFSRTTMFSQVTGFGGGMGGLGSVTGLPEPPQEMRPKVRPRQV